MMWQLNHSHQGRANNGMHPTANSVNLMREAWL
jgi:hypothetical protein